MSARASSRRNPPLLPEGVSLFLRQRLIEGAGTLSIALGVLLALALASYSPIDPSFNSAGTEEARNVLGRPGAYAADLVLQGGGLAGGLLALIAGAWGWSLLRRHRLSLWPLRLPLGLLAVGFAALALGSIPRLEAWPLEADLGGTLGALAARELLPLAEAVGLPAPAVGIVAAVFMVAALASTLGLTGTEWRALGRGARRGSRGLLWALRTTAQLTRSRPQAEERPLRREPRLGTADVTGNLGEARDSLGSRGGPPLEIVGRRSPKPRPGRRPEAERQAMLDLMPEADYQLPPLDLLLEP